MERNRHYLSIEDHGVIGNMNSCALVGLDGRIDFLCFPHFDSPSLFASLLDHRRGGAFSIRTKVDSSNHQFYFPDTNILITRFLNDGVAEVNDFMPIGDRKHDHSLIRLCKGIRGSVKLQLAFSPRFDYARSPHKIEQKGGHFLVSSLGQDRTRIIFWSNIPLTIQGADIVADFTLSRGEEVAFIMKCQKEDEGEREEEFSASLQEVDELLTDTINFWKGWIEKINYTGRWMENVHRSALVLKILFSKDYGSFAAAPTFGLPEEINGIRNWDYRYMWIRDSSYILYSLVKLGLEEEAKGFMKWLMDQCNIISDKGPPLQVMYGLDGRKDLHEFTLDHFEGYKKSAPVRVGNAAYSQLQLDIYGELMDAIYIIDKHVSPVYFDTWRHLVHLVDWVCENWCQKDEGIWEFRGGRHEFLHSRLMCWVCIDRALKISLKRSFPAPFLKWRKTRDRIFHDIHENFWNSEKSYFVQYKGSEFIDASVLMMPLVKFISPTDPKWLSTLKAVEEHLLVDTLIYRYNLEAVSDGLQGKEGTFSPCSFWYVSCLARSGQIQKARFIFEKMLVYGNHLGLYSEELGPRGEHLGNFPQALTHLALLNAAIVLNKEMMKREIKRGNFDCDY